MKKFLITALVALSLGGCSTLQNIGSAISLGTASITNPITKTRLNQIESAAIVLFAGLNTWKASCVQGLIPATCRAQITTVQIYARQIPPYLGQLRSFVKNNDQINAVAVFNNLTSLIDTIKSQAAASGVAVGG